MRDFSSTWCQPCGRRRTPCWSARFWTCSSPPPFSSSQSQTCNGYLCNYHVHLILLLHLEWCFSSFAILNIFLQSALAEFLSTTNGRAAAAEVEIRNQLLLWEKLCSRRDDSPQYRKKVLQSERKNNSAGKKKEAINHWDLSFTPERKESASKKRETLEINPCREQSFCTARLFLSFSNATFL